MAIGGSTGRKKALNLAAAWLATALLLSACGAGSKPSSTGTAAFQSVDQRLQGDWRVVSFVPETALLPTLRELFSFQYDQLVVHIKNGRVRANSAGLNFDRAYRIVNPLDEQFTIIIADEQGMEYVCRAHFDPTDQLVFQSLTDPWKGHGVLRKLDAGALAAEGL